MMLINFFLCDQNCFAGPCAYPIQNREENDHLQSEKQNRKYLFEQQPPLVERELNHTEATSIITRTLPNSLRNFSATLLAMLLLLPNHQNNALNQKHYEVP